MITPSGDKPVLLTSISDVAERLSVPDALRVPALMSMVATVTGTTTGSQEVRMESL